MLPENRDLSGLDGRGRGTQSDGYDAGDKLGFLKATVEFALRRHDLGAEFRQYLKSLQL